ncbi:hypothetical protein R6Q57_018513 [Mikania cordata]
MPTITVEPIEPVPRSTESTMGPSFHTEDVHYDSFLIGEIRARADKGKNVLPDDEPIDVVRLQSIVFELEQDSLSNTLLIQELKLENEAKDKKIKELETNMGHIVEPKPGMNRAEFDELNRSREEGLRKYFAIETRFKVSIVKSRELTMITERTVQEARDAA